MTEVYSSRDEDKTIIQNNEGPSILKEEIVAAIKYTKPNKATGPDNVAVEMIEALGEYELEAMKTLFDKIYNSGKIPDDLSNIIFIALPKKAGAIECENHRIISLMSHITKIFFLSIIMKRIRNEIRPEYQMKNVALWKERELLMPYIL